MNHIIKDLKDGKIKANQNVKTCLNNIIESLKQLGNKMKSDTKQ